MLGTDVDGAYDNVLHSVLELTLRRFRVPDHERKLIMSTLDAKKKKS